MKQSFLTLTCSVLILSACAGSKYVPEVQGSGAMHAKEAILYSIPASHPVFKMKVESNGVDRDRSLQVSLYLLRKAKTSSAYLIPDEQVLVLSNQLELIPTKVRANGAKRNKIELSSDKTLIQLAYGLPPGMDKADDIEKFYFRWKIHVGKNSVETQTIRFNREDREAHPSTNGPDPDNQYFDRNWLPGTTWW